MDFIRTVIARDLKTGKYGGRVVTRFPPEPNGFLHVGHAKAICLNFGIAAEHPGGRCHLRLDDTNPDTERAEYVEAMKRDIRWLGFDWGEHLYHASDYFERLYQYALVLIDKGLAYVDSSSEAEIRERRGSVTRPGVDSPYRGRNREENRDLFERMRAGEFPDGSHVLRARIDMAHTNMVMRDPLLYRIRHAHHYRQEDDWPIYPMYDFAHCLSDSVERVTHSLCTLEFENNREIYDWLLEHVDAPRPRPEQTEFAPLVLDYVITSKRLLRRLVEAGEVRGWDDPRMPTLAGLRRRGVTPDAIRTLCDMVGVARAHSRVGMDKLEFAVRDDLNHKAPRAFCVLDPLKVVLTNYPEGREQVFTAPQLPGDADTPGTRDLPFGRVLYIDRADFREDPPPGFHRLVPGGTVRLKYACVIRCDQVLKDEAGEVTELRCSVLDREGPGAETAVGPRVRGTIHWVRAESAVPVEVRLLDRMFTVAEPPTDDIVAAMNPDSERVVTGALAEPGVAGTPPGTHYQFERHGYFFSDPVDSGEGHLVFNRTVTLRDSWAERARATGTSSTRHGAGRSGRNGTDRDTAARHLSPEETLRTPGQRLNFREVVSQGVSEAAAASLVRSQPALNLFHAARADYPDGAASIADWLVNEVSRLVAATEGAGLELLEPAALSSLAHAVDTDDLSHRQGRRVVEALVTRGISFEEARASLDLIEIDDEAMLSSLLQQVADEYPDKVAAYQGGQHGLLGFFVGQVMRRSRGKADPRKANELAKGMFGPA
ncbi:MAG: glutamine--tRNA ligase/YqeY domain fusion protein [Gemmatimonadetes bacterium]|nr:glutamine--tRNA ligase/YqeY domain fusion protein [Gemmatimonadota bacterium]